MGVADPSSSGYPFGSGPSAGEVIDSYNAANWSGRMPEFMLANSNSEVENAFKTYANKIIKFGDNVFTHIEIADYFNIYDGYPGMSKWYKTTGEKTQSASRSGNKVKWDLVYIPLTGANTLTFYVKIDEGKTDKDLWYFLANHSYIEYVDTQFQTGQGYVKYFPEPVVQGTGSGTTNVPGSTANGFYTPTESPSTDSGVANLGIYSFGTPIPPYTPSVTPKPTKIPTSGVDEETVENGADEDVDDNTDVDDETDNNEEEDFDINDEDTDDTDDQQDMTPPVTGQATGAVTAAILAGLAGMAMFVTYSRKREEK